MAVLLLASVVYFGFASVMGVRVLWPSLADTPGLVVLAWPRL